MSAEHWFGKIPSIIRNRDGLYEGDLEYYFRLVFFQAPNVRHPYHNFRHMLHVMVQCYDGAVYHRDELSKQQVRNLLIAALFHDYGHMGRSGNDDLNIIAAIRAEIFHLHDADGPQFGDIARLIKTTKYPHEQPAEALDLSGCILRDADVSQGLGTVWLQDVVFGLAAEMGVTPLEMLKKEERFIRELSFCSGWGRAQFPQSLIDAKVAEVRELLDILEPAKAA